jgi:ATP-dependent DNA ligase
LPPLSSGGVAGRSSTPSDRQFRDTLAVPLGTDESVSEGTIAVRRNGFTGLDWVHEIKHDGYRLIVRRAPELIGQ